MIADGVFVAVKQGEGGAPVAVARLADRTGVDEIPRGLRELDGFLLGLIVDVNAGLDFASLAAFVAEAALDVAVAEKGASLQC